MPRISKDDISNWIGKETGTSDWVTIDQARIDQFAEVTGDRQFIHIDPEAAQKTPFGGTIAHGFLTLSMLSQMGAGSVLVLDGVKMGINYGFEKIRFINPVRSGKRIRAHFTLMAADEKMPGQFQFKYAVKVEIEGDEKPALMAEWLTMQMV